MRTSCCGPACPTRDRQAGEEGSSDFHSLSSSTRAARGCKEGLWGSAGPLPQSCLGCLNPYRDPSLRCAPFGLVIRSTPICSLKSIVGSSITWTTHICWPGHNKNNFWDTPLKNSPLLTREGELYTVYLASLGNEVYNRRVYMWHFPLILCLNHFGVEQLCEMYDINSLLPPESVVDKCPASPPDPQPSSDIAALSPRAVTQRQLGLGT